MPTCGFSWAVQNTLAALFMKFLQLEFIKMKNHLSRKSRVMKGQRRSHLFVEGMLLIIAVGCGGRGDGFTAPNFDPFAASQDAIDTYDTDKNGFISGEELEKTPGLKAGIKNFDSDGDGQVSADEISQRVETWVHMDMALMSLSCDVTLDGQPLEGAVVTFDPEEYLGGVTQQAVGTTSMIGVVMPKVPKEKRPSLDAPPGIQPGLYRVRVSKVINGKETIPARYNTETILGIQVSKDDAAIVNKAVRFNLKSN